MAVARISRQRQLEDGSAAALNAPAATVRLHRSVLITWFAPVALLLSVLMVSGPIVVEGAGGSGVCDGGCQNGGKLLMPNNLFGYCRCRCPPDFKGPKCQFIDKRSGHQLTSGFGLGAGQSDDVSVRDILRELESAMRRQELLRRFSLIKAAASYDGDKPQNGLMYGFTAEKSHRE